MGLGASLGDGLHRTHAWLRGHGLDFRLAPPPNLFAVESMQGGVGYVRSRPRPMNLERSSIHGQPPAAAEMRHEAAVGPN